MSMIETSTMYKRGESKLSHIIFGLAKIIGPIVVLIRSDVVISSSLLPPHMPNEGMVCGPWLLQKTSDSTQNLLLSESSDSLSSGLSFEVDNTYKSPNITVNGTEENNSMLISTKMPNGLPPKENSNLFNACNTGSDADPKVCTPDDAEYWSDIKDFRTHRFSSFSKRIFRILLEHVSIDEHTGQVKATLDSKKKGSSLKKCDANYLHDLNKLSEMSGTDKLTSEIVNNIKDFLVYLKNVISHHMSKIEFFNLCLEQEDCMLGSSEIYRIVSMFDVFYRDTKLRSDDKERIDRLIEDRNPSILMNQTLHSMIKQKCERELKELENVQDRTPPSDNGHNNPVDAVSQFHQHLNFLRLFERWRMAVERVNGIKEHVKSTDQTVKLTKDDIYYTEFSWLERIQRTDNVHVEINEMPLLIPAELFLLSNITTLTVNFQKPSEDDSTACIEKYIKDLIKSISTLPRLRRLVLLFNNMPLILEKSLPCIPQLEELEMDYPSDLSQTTCDVLARWVGGCRNLRKFTILEFGHERIPEKLRGVLSAIKFPVFSISFCTKQKKFYISEDDMSFLTKLHVFSVRAKQLYLPLCFFDHFACPKNVSIEKKKNSMCKVTPKQFIRKMTASQFTFKAKKELNGEQNDSNPTVIE
ncbi:uncharacterized protein VICG_00659 [Vittaforma corneae ATCC 50505]|uniref:Uncharacterized protein n=1 Tax=Vittaforma corneae (strain ATCC 50505) TaxID=993615 RepID=L2GP26_VITCO|nr:uncharacterized protein VICG_00659 [Vittaforma corneae ATCC 50505]ELA42260.1 hypothetical protein VICG_00659 [Vittaforma corneae ATCC 50505]